MPDLSTTCANCDGILVSKALGEGMSPYCERCQSWWTDSADLMVAHRHRRPAPLGSVVSLVLEDNDTEHDDLVVRVGTWAHRADSYYHALDHSPDSPPDVLSSIRAMLRQWLDVVSEAKEGEAFYLPFDFSDQCTGWLRGLSEHGRVTVQPGWSSREGWSFYPSSFHVEGISPADFRVAPHSEPLSIPVSDLIEDIRRSLALRAPWAAPKAK